jgi:hypothetical protein
VSKPTGNPNGRPPKRTAEATRKVIEALENNLSNQDAADHAGVCLRTLERWLADEGFHEQIKSAKVARKLKRLQTIEAGGKSWTASAWLLERSEPHKYGRPEVQIAISASQAQPVQNAFFLAGSFTGAADPVIESLIDSVPIELQNSPPESIEVESTVTQVPSVPSVYTCPQPAPPSNEGTSMRLLRTGYQENRPNLKPKYTVAPVTPPDTEKTFVDFSNNDPIL